MAVHPMPGTVKALRVMLFVGGFIVLISGGITLMSAMSMGTPDSVAADVLAAEGNSTASSAALGAAGLAYGVALIVCGALVGRSTAVVEWGISGGLLGYVVVHVLVSFLDGDSIHGVVFLPVIITFLMRTKSAREYFRGSDSRGSDSRGSHSRGSHSRDDA